MIAGLVLALATGQSPATNRIECPPETVEPERVFSGVYIDEFEGQQFFEGANGVTAIDRRARPRTWIDIDPVGLGGPFGITHRQYSTAYRVKFIGIRRSRAISRFPCGYGHLGVFDADMRIVRLLAIEPIGRSVSSDNRR